MPKKARMLSLLLCLLLVLPVLAGCIPANEDPTEIEVPHYMYITMYLTDDVIDLDPARAYYNDTALNLCSMLFETLFSINSKGKLEKKLVSNYTIEESNRYGECVMTISLKATKWSNGLNYVTADDVVFAWKRLLNASNSLEAASLLFDIKNARAVKRGDMSIDDLGIYAIGDFLLEIIFEEPINYDQFLRNLASVALAPLLESAVNGTDDWAKKNSTCPTSGPYRFYKVSTINVEKTLKDADTNIRSANSDIEKARKDLEAAQAAGDAEKIEAAEQTILEAQATIENANAAIEKYKDVPYKTFYDASIKKNATQSYTEYFVLQRNPYYFRDFKNDPEDKSVTPYRIIVQTELSAEALQQAYDNGEIFYIGDIPYSLRTVYANQAKVSDRSFSTFSFSLNENALVKSSTNPDGEKIFAIKEVRQALSLALNRQEFADAAVFADPATGFVPTAVFNTDSSKKTFRSVGGDLISSSADMAAAKAKLSAAGITPSNYTFSITVPEYDDVQTELAKLAQKAWTELGFNVEIYELGFISNNDYYKPTDSTPTDIMDDLYAEALRAGNYEVLAYDAGAISTDAFSVLSPYATAFSGRAIDFINDETATTEPHITGYSNPNYDEIIEAVYAEKKDLNKKAQLLHQAEELLVEDMPVIPVIFNKQAVLISDQLKNITSDYYGYDFKRTYLKDWLDYEDAFKALIGLKK